MALDNAEFVSTEEARNPISKAQIQQRVLWLCHARVGSTFQTSSPTTTSIHSLPGDFWFLVCEYLYIADSYLPGSSFAGWYFLQQLYQKRSKPYQLLTFNVSISLSDIMSERVLWRRKLISRFDYNGSGKVIDLPWLSYNTPKRRETKEVFVWEGERGRIRKVIESKLVERIDKFPL